MPLTFKLLALNHGTTQINDDAIDRFLLNPEFDEASYDKHAASYTFTFPLRFANDVAELNLTGLLGLVSKIYVSVYPSLYSSMTLAQFRERTR